MNKTTVKADESMMLTANLSGSLVAPTGGMTIALSISNAVSSTPYSSSTVIIIAGGESEQRKYHYQDEYSNSSR